MIYGLIGEKLSHSFSKIIHDYIGGYEYEIKELAPSQVDGFMKAKDFKAINVTIPYKETVMPYLDFISEQARAIGSVNTIINSSGTLYGYNTDYFGLKALLDRVGVNAAGKTVLILGSGGTAKTARAVLSDDGAKEIVTVSRSPVGDYISYSAAITQYAHAEIIINTTPCGMFPHADETPIDLKRFGRLECVIDAIYNPLSTCLVRTAKSMGVKASGGLYMLVAQGVIASGLFFGKPPATERIDAVYDKILSYKRNIVLIGMPGAGKSTVGKILAKSLNRELIDTDEVIVSRIGMPIADFFVSRGEAEFRQIESEVVAEASTKNGVIIATGGGAILNAKNLDALRGNGIIYFVDRPLDLIRPTPSRPLSMDRDALKKRYEERYPLYLSAADKRVESDGDSSKVAQAIKGDFV
jgi:shikimate dehydrogenase